MKPLGTRGTPLRHEVRHFCQSRLDPSMNRQGGMSAPFMPDGSFSAQAHETSSGFGSGDGSMARAGVQALKAGVEYCDAYAR